MEELHIIIIDLDIRASPTASTVIHPENQTWHRVQKRLNLNFDQPSPWLYVQRINEAALSINDLIVVDVRIGEPPSTIGTKSSWEQRSNGIWLLREKFCGQPGQLAQAVTEVDVLYGSDAVDPRLGWTILEPFLEVGDENTLPRPRLTIRHGTPPVAEPAGPLRVNTEGKFKIVQFSDTHMVTGVGICTDAIDADGNHLPDCPADPLTVRLMEQILDVEEPDFVVLTGDQLHHDILDSQTALLKVVAPIIERSIPFAAVFGNHDSEGEHALSREAQMKIFQDLPFSLCEPGPEEVAGIGNYSIPILAQAPSTTRLSTLYFLDSHGQVKSSTKDPDYKPIHQSQIDWFKSTAEAHQISRDDDASHLSMAFFHIPLPEFGSSDLKMHNGRRGEPTECPSVNTHFFDTLRDARVSSVACGHDHVNDFCGMLMPSEAQQVDQVHAPGPWLCHSGTVGFGGYCSYGGTRYHRRARVWELDTTNQRLRMWKRVEYCPERVDEADLVCDGTSVVPDVVKI